MSKRTSETDAAYQEGYDFAWAQNGHGKFPHKVYGPPVKENCCPRCGEIEPFAMDCGCDAKTYSNNEHPMI